MPVLHNNCARVLRGSRSSFFFVVACLLLLCALMNIASNLRIRVMSMSPTSTSSSASSMVSSTDTSAGHHSTSDTPEVMLHLHPLLLPLRASKRIKNRLYPSTSALEPSSSKNATSFIYRIANPAGIKVWKELNNRSHFDILPFDSLIVGTLSLSPTYGKYTLDVLLPVNLRGFSQLNDKREVEAFLSRVASSECTAELFSGRDIPGYDVATLKASGKAKCEGNDDKCVVSECCTFCRNHATCNAFTFNPGNKLCFLKAVTPGITLKEVKRAGLISGFVAKSAGDNPDGLPRCMSASDRSSFSEDRDSPSSYRQRHVLQMENSQSFGKWTSQWPMGNGLLGALVGGPMHIENIPISVADLFIRSIKAKRSPEIKVLLDDEIGDLTGKAFRRARDFLIKGEHDKAYDIMEALTTNQHLGMFQYFFDIFTVISAKRLGVNEKEDLEDTKKSFHAKREPNSYDSLFSVLSTLETQSSDGASPNLPLSSISINGKNVNLNGEAYSDSFCSSGTGEKDILNSLGYSSIQYSKSSLDVSQGICDSNYMAVVLNDSAETISNHSLPANIENQDNVATLPNFVDYFSYSKKYFASEADDVLAGYITCSKVRVDQWTNITESIDTSCLNIAIDVRRSSNPNHDVPLKVLKIESQDSTWHDDSDQKTDSFDLIYFIHLGLENEPSKQLEVPPMKALMAVVCRSRFDSIYSKDSVRRYSKKRGIVVCNGASMAQIYVTLNRDLDFDKAREKLSSLIHKGVDYVTSRHKTHFSGRFDKVKLNFEPPFDNEAAIFDVIPSETIKTRLRNFGKNSCFDVDSRRVIQSQSFIDSRLLSQVYSFSRYLLLSSSTQSVPNLQGIWSEGPSSAWNGDYHMNINTQMHLWPADTSGLSESVIEPFIKFMKKLSTNGKITARNLYGCKNGGWVSHGFTDSTLRPDIYGQPEWALCVTCGAWLAVQLFDHAQFHFDVDQMAETIVPILRDAIVFFTEYMWVNPDDSSTHTGPTTSPENSYKYLQSSPVGDAANLPIIQNEKIPLPDLSLNLKLKLNLNPNQIPDPNNKGTNINPPNVAPKWKFGYIAMSPTFDSNMLRQLSNAFKISISWVKYLKPTAFQESDEMLSKNFESMIRRMRGGALPLVGLHEKQSILLEYDNPFASDTAKSQFKLDEFHDLGHRHFSSLQWVYPGLFQPGSVTDTDITRSYTSAGVNTLLAKSARNSGHTSWSSSWRSSLWARFFDGQRSLESLQQIINRYMAPNMLSLHPNLEHDDMDCHTCFLESFDDTNKMNYDHRTTAKCRIRGFETLDDSKFQLDGNTGLVAAVDEMLVQSHVNGVLILLPALPERLARFGSVEGLNSRGDITIAMSWTQNNVDFMSLSASKFNPALNQLIEESSGYFSVDSTPFESIRTNGGDLSTARSKINIFYPGKDMTIQSDGHRDGSSKAKLHGSKQSKHSSCARWVQSKLSSGTTALASKLLRSNIFSAASVASNSTRSHFSNLDERFNSGELFIDSFPCSITFVKSA